MNQIQSTTLAGIICRNSDGVESVQKYVMKNLASDNQIENCRDIDTFLIDAWKETTYRNQMTSITAISQVSAIKTVPRNKI